MKFLIFCVRFLNRQAREERKENLLKNLRALSGKDRAAYGREDFEIKGASELSEALLYFSEMVVE